MRGGVWSNPKVMMPFFLHNFFWIFMKKGGGYTKFKSLKHYFPIFGWYRTYQKNLNSSKSLDFKKMGFQIFKSLRGRLILFWKKLKLKLNFFQMSSLRKAIRSGMHLEYGHCQNWQAPEAPPPMIFFQNFKNS